MDTPNGWLIAALVCACMFTVSYVTMIVNEEEMKYSITVADKQRYFKRMRKWGWIALVLILPTCTLLFKGVKKEMDEHEKRKIHME